MEGETKRYGDGVMLLGNCYSLTNLDVNSGYVLLQSGYKFGELRYLDNKSRLFLLCGNCLNTLSNLR